MTKEEALQNIENLINISVQKGLFANANDVLALVESYNIIKNDQVSQMHSHVIEYKKGTVTTSADNFPEKQENAKG